MMDESLWVRAGDRAAIESRRLRCVRVDARLVALFVFQGRLYAFDDECPHRGAHLSDGDISEDGYVACPLHAWEYHIETGKGRDDWEGCVTTYEVREVDGVVFVRRA